MPVFWRTDEIHLLPLMVIMLSVVKFLMSTNDIPVKLQKTFNIEVMKII